MVNAFAYQLVLSYEPTNLRQIQENLMYVQYCAEKCCLFLTGLLSALRIQMRQVMEIAGRAVQGRKDATQPHGTCMKHTLADVVEISFR